MFIFKYTHFYHVELTYLRCYCEKILEAVVCLKNSDSRTMTTTMTNWKEKLLMKYS